MSTISLLLVMLSEARSLVCSAVSLLACYRTLDHHCIHRQTSLPILNPGIYPSILKSANAQTMQREL